MSFDDAYRQGLADYEAALVAQAQQASASPEVYYYQGLIDYEQALLQQAATAEAGATGDALYLQGMADYEALLLQQQQQSQQGVNAAAGAPDDQEAYTLGLMHYEAELLAASLAAAVEKLSPEQRAAYDRGRGEYESALAQQQGASGAQGGTPQAAPSSKGGSSGQSGRQGKRNTRRRSRG